MSQFSAVDVTLIAGSAARYGAAGADPSEPGQKVHIAESGRVGDGVEALVLYAATRGWRDSGPEHLGVSQFARDVLCEHDRGQVGGRSRDGRHDRGTRDGEGVDPVNRALRVGDRTHSQPCASRGADAPST